MTGASVELIGMQEIASKIKDLESLKAVKIGMKAGAEHLKSRAGARRKVPPRQPRHAAASIATARLPSPGCAGRGAGPC